MLRVSLALSGGLFLAGCFYTGSINERPRAEIEKVSPGPYHYPRETVRFVARKSSDGEDGADLVATWSAYTCPTPESCDPLGETTALALSSEYAVTIPDRNHDPIRVQLVIRDKNGAESRDVETLEVGNRAPVVTVQVRQGGQAPGLSSTYVVTVPIEVAVEVEDPDGDDTTTEWALMRPRESNPDGVTWRPLDETGTVYELIPDVAGVWRVDLTASDGLPEGTEVHMEQILVDEDQPPCIGITSPASPGDGRHVLRREDGPRAFTVLHVADDLDPSPRPVIDSPYLGTTTFGWSLAGPETAGELVPIAGATGPEVVIDPAGRAPGDLLELRVDVSDRVDRPATCGAAEPVCSTSDTCFQRLTWEIEIR
ncbi:MAG TPA: hypothetical protein VFU21_28965 [Kofleriaceae bacterium]|nr:hypothetical protein [Kofleriaceae bacterium]